MTSPPLTEKWVPLWPLAESVLGELAYAQITSPTAALTSGTAPEGTPLTVVTAPTITLDGATPIIVEFFAQGVVLPVAAGAVGMINIWDGSTDLGRLAAAVSPAASASMAVASHGAVRLTPSAGSHTYSARLWGSVGSVINAGVGGAGSPLPAFIRVTLAKPVVPADPPPGTWQDYTPVLACYGGANPALGSLGATRGRYCQVGKLVTVQGEINMEGTGINPSSGNYRISLPVPTISASGAGGYRPAGEVEIWGTGTEYVQGTLYPADTTTVAITYPGGTLGPSKGVDHANPWVPVSPYRIFFHLTYEAA